MYSKCMKRKQHMFSLMISVNFSLSYLQIWEVRNDSLTQMINQNCLKAILSMCKRQMIAYQHTCQQRTTQTCTDGTLSHVGLSYTQLWPKMCSNSVAGYIYITCAFVYKCNTPVATCMYVRDHGVGHMNTVCGLLYWILYVV